MQNIVVDTEQSLVKIIDFGLSNYWSLEEPLATLCGSPEYAAPELFISSRKYGPEVDLWSLGVVMFCMSTGYLPFCLNEQERSLSHDYQRRLLVTRIKKGIVEKHKNCLSHYSKEFSNLISGLLMTKPYQRFRIEQVLCHPWTTKSPNLLLDIPKTVTPNNDINEKIIWKMCRIVNSMPKEIEKRLEREPLGAMGGIHRILYHEELKRHWKLFEVFSPLHALSGSLSSGSLIISRRDKIIMRPDAVKAKSAETCKPAENEFNGIYDSSEKLQRGSLDSANEQYHLYNSRESSMNFRQEPWSSNFSSTMMNTNQHSLIVASLRRKNGSYNFKKSEYNNSVKVNTLHINTTAKMEDGTVQSDTSSVSSSRPTTRSERRTQERWPVSADSKIGGNISVNVIGGRFGNNVKKS